MNLDRIIKQNLWKVLNEQNLYPLYSNADAIWLSYTQVLNRLAKYASDRYANARKQEGKQITMDEVSDFMKLINDNLNAAKADSGI